LFRLHFGSCNLHCSHIVSSSSFVPVVIDRFKIAGSMAGHIIVFRIWYVSVPCWLDRLKLVKSLILRSSLAVFPLTIVAVECQRSGSYRICPESTP